jgi:hypothetical protein
MIVTLALYSHGYGLWNVGVTPGGGCAMGVGAEDMIVNESTGWMEMSGMYAIAMAGGKKAEYESSHSDPNDYPPEGGS